MKRYTYLSLIISAIIFFMTSCQDIINIELGSTEPKLVVEGSINNINDSCTIKLTQTGDYFNSGSIKTVSGAQISITADNIGIVNFAENPDGVYIAKNLQGEENNSYKLNISFDNEEYNATAKIPQKVNIDSVSFMYFPPTPRIDGGFMVNVHFTDPKEFTNYYRYKVYKIGDENRGNGNFALNDDKFINGNSTMMPYNHEVFQLADTIVAELQTLNKSTFDFYNTLSGIAGNSGGPPMANTTPANPENNISNGALGNFCAYTVCRDTMIVIMPFLP